MRVFWDPNMDMDRGAGGVRVYCPTFGGEVNFNFVHSVVPEKNCDIWRMTTALYQPKDGEAIGLTKAHAEWEMALRLRGRPDFIGGYNHGDERGEEPVFLMDGKAVKLSSLEIEKTCNLLEILVHSVGFDPSEPEKAVLEHTKHYQVTDKGVLLFQRIRWLCDVELDERFKSYLAMMPPMKHQKEREDLVLTDEYRLEKGEFSSIESLPVEAKNCSLIQVRGKESGFVFSMEGANYSPLYPASYDAILTDNGGANYHKMYLCFAGGDGGRVAVGTTWEGTTRYEIKKEMR